MNTSDAMVILLGAFPLDGVLADGQANMAHLFTGDFEFAATELDAETLRLSAQLSGLGTGKAGLARRLLEANLAGVETGFGAIAPDPVGSGDYALVDHVDVSGLDADDFRLRVVDFMLYAEYWRAEGVGVLQAEVHRDARDRARDGDMVFLRG